MNKDLINKYKKEFDHFLAGERVICTDWEESNTIWREVDSSGDDWTYTGPNPPKFVINDAWCELRIAQVEGKIIQFKGTREGGCKEDVWHDAVWDAFVADGAVRGIKNWRIKPFEPKFPCYYREKSSGIVVKFESRENPKCYNLNKILGVVVKGVNTPQKTEGFIWRCWDTFSYPDRWEAYEPEYFELKNAPRQKCFSREGFDGSYYRESEGDFHKYDSDGNYSGSVFPLSSIGKKYYRSNKDGSYYFKSNKPKFKVGDTVTITSNSDTWTDVIVRLDKNKYHFKTGGHLGFDRQDEQIKEFVHEFKVGDFVLTPGARGREDCLFVGQVTEECGIKIFETFTYYTSSIDGSTLPWKPEYKEWCWCWNNSDVPVLRQVLEIMDCGYITDRKTYAYCEPFIGELPSWLKNQK